MARRATIQLKVHGKVVQSIPLDQQDIECLIEGLRQVSLLLEAKAPTDAAAFKTWLAALAERVAAASKEGGFLGFGGVQVSDAEKATLGEISAALGHTA